ncbi:MAG: hypothetical protein LBF97_06940 [Elusimicrobiota bacterium]|nr:hypothetical protein [Elusimicrobiota bacterium]
MKIIAEKQKTDYQKNLFPWIMPRKEYKKICFFEKESKKNQNRIKVIQNTLKTAMAIM